MPNARDPEYQVQGLYVLLKNTSWSQDNVQIIFSWKLKKKLFCEGIALNIWHAKTKYFKVFRTDYFIFLIVMTVSSLLNQ